MNLRHKKRYRNSRGVVLLAGIPLVFALNACDMSTLLDVDVPGDVTADNLERPEMAAIVRASAIGEFECAWDSYRVGAAAHSDEYIQSTGNIDAARQMHRNIDEDYPRYATADCALDWGIWTPFQQARVMLDQNFDRLQTFTDAQVPNRRRFMAEMRAYAGWVYQSFGENFCGAVFDGDRQVRPPEVSLNLAIERFSEAIQLAEAGGHTDLLNMALVGRARALLNLNQYAAAIADAERIPPGFRFEVTRDASSPRRYNSMDFLGRLETQRNGSMAPSYWDVRWKGVPDPRVNVTETPFVGFDNATIVWRHDKIPPSGGRNQNERLASYEEAQSFIAEAAALSGDLDRARTILQWFHDKAGIPPVTVEDIPTQADVIRHVIENSRREFLVEGAHRLRSHIRWRGTEFEVPFLGEPGSDHPNGVDQYEQPYGNATCYPVPLAELL